MACCCDVHWVASTEPSNACAGPADRAYLHLVDGPVADRRALVGQRLLAAGLLLDVPGCGAALCEIAIRGPAMKPMPVVSVPAADREPHAAQPVGHVAVAVVDGQAGRVGVLGAVDRLQDLHLLGDQPHLDRPVLAREELLPAGFRAQQRLRGLPALLRVGVRVVPRPSSAGCSGCSGRSGNSAGPGVRGSPSESRRAAAAARPARRSSGRPAWSPTAFSTTVRAGSLAVTSAGGRRRRRAEFMRYAEIDRPVVLRTAQRLAVSGPQRQAEADRDRDVDLTGQLDAGRVAEVGPVPASVGGVRAGRDPGAGADRQRRHRGEGHVGVVAHVPGSSSPDCRSCRSGRLSRTPGPWARR